MSTLELVLEKGPAIAPGVGGTQLVMGGGEELVLLAESGPFDVEPLNTSDVLVLPVTGVPGEDGQDGHDGEDGDGTDTQDLTVLFENGLP